MAETKTDVALVDVAPILQKLDEAIAEEGHTEKGAQALDRLVATAKSYRCVYDKPTPRTITPDELAENQVVAFVSNRDFAVQGGKISSLTRDEDGTITDLVINNGRVRYLPLWLTETTTIIVHKNAPVEEPDEAR